MIVSGSEECSIWAAPGSLSDMFYTDRKEAKMCEASMMKEVKPSRESVFFEHENVQRAGGKWNENDELRYYLYVIYEDTDRNDAVLFAAGDSMQRDEQ